MIDFTCYVFSHHGYTPVLYQANKRHKYPLHIAVTLFWSSSDHKRLQLFVDRCHSQLSRVALLSLCLLYLYRNRMCTCGHTIYRPFLRIPSTCSTLFFHCFSRNYTSSLKAFKLDLYNTNKHKCLLLL
jgi:hypothetical protein